MPVSNPGYFPPQRQDFSIVGTSAGFASTGDKAFLAGQSAGAGSTVADLIIVGYLAGVGPITDADAAGSIIVGNRSEGLVTAWVGGADTVMGTDVAPAAANPMGDNVLIGNQVLLLLNAASPGTFRQNVVIGAKCARDMLGPNNNIGSSTQNVIIGYEAMLSQGLYNEVSGSVVIGALACSAMSGGPGPTANIDNCVVVGRLAGNGWASAVATQVIRSVAIGENAGSTLQNGADNVFVGANADISTNLSLFSVTVMGQGATTSADDVVVIGKGSIAVADLSICIGARAGQSSTANVLPGKIVVEAFDGNLTRYGALFGVMSTGNLILGNSSDAQREFAGIGATNFVKLLNGTPGDTNPVGGGYFYVSAGALHWVGSAGTDTAVAPA